MTAKPEEIQSAGRIEGGIDAIVIGASADGLAAAAYLGKAGLRTLLLEESAEIGGPVRTRDIAPGVTGIDGEHLVRILDPDVISDLDLYRFGVKYAARRLDSVYYFDDEESLQLDGDLQHAADLMLDDDTRDQFGAFMRDALELAAFLRPVFAPLRSVGDENATKQALDKALGQASPEISALITSYAMASIEDVLNGRFEDGPVKTLLTSEAAFLSGAAPHEAFSFMGFLRSLAGETAGLQGASAYPEGGAVAIINALRRSVQAAKVEIRAAARVKSILIEWDRAAGVVLENGGQVRAPVIVNALDAPRAFLDMIGPDIIDIEFQRMLTAPRKHIASARVQLTLKGVAEDETTKENLNRRLVYAPPPEEVRRAFIDARAGRVPEKLIIEAIFPGALDSEAALDGDQLLSVVAHPLPFDEEPDRRRRNEISTAILAMLENVAPDIGEQVDIVDLRLPCDLARATGASSAAYVAKPAIMQQWAMANISASASDIGGVYFCGPEAQIGAGLSCTAGKNAAKAAIREFKKRGGAL